jgi:hypothetical protein
MDYMGKMVQAGAGVGIFDKLEMEPESEPHKNGLTLQHCLMVRGDDVYVPVPVHSANVTQFDINV